MEKKALIEGVSTLEQRLQTRDRVFTIGDASAITGFGMDEAKQALDRLMQMYDCRLKVTENGDLIYDFGSLHKRGERTWAEWWHLTQLWLWKIFVFLFKIWISVTLVVYFVIFLVILIALIVAMMAGNKDGDSSSGSSSSDGGFFDFIGEIFRSIFIWNTHTPRTYYERDGYGYDYRSYEPIPSTLAKVRKKDPQKSKGFVASVYDFVFGPERVEMTREDQQKEVASYVRQNQGLITMPELIALGGWNREKGEDFFSEVIVKYQGDSKISENAVLYGDFYTLARSQSSGGDAPIIYYWDEYSPEYKLTGNTWWRNAGVIGMNLFNLSFATFFVTGALNQADIGIDEGTSQMLSIGLGWIPFTFSFLFFLVPILRYFQMQPLRRKRYLENIRKRIMKAIYLQQSAEIPLETLLAAVNSQAKGEAKLDKSTVERMMQELIYDFNGEIAIQNNGQIVYKFQNLQEELAEVRQLRSQRGSSKDLGKIIMDSQDE
ncbi:MAG: hypothetical protein MUE85_20745 [Microscillaceae bacterium]|jgi:hypothetical protein|nr:hypothetical protein [Microscillaceae bacterium]